MEDRSQQLDKYIQQVEPLGTLNSFIVGYYLDIALHPGPGRDNIQQQQQQQQPAQTVVVVPVQALALSNGLGGGLGLHSGLGMGGGIRLGRVHPRLARRGIGMY